MTQKKFKRKLMEDFVCEYFIRVCKNHNIYNTFMKSFNNVMRQRSDRNPFGQFGNIFELSKKLEEFTEREYSKHASRNDDYERVTMMINHMLHFFLEKGGVDPRQLGMLGQEIFDLTCYGMYGEKYLKDMQMMQREEPRATNMKEAALLSEFMRLKKQSNFNMTWEEFLQEYLPKLNWMDNDEEICVEDDDDFYDFDDDDANNNEYGAVRQNNELPW